MKPSLVSLRSYFAFPVFLIISLLQISSVDAQSGCGFTLSGKSIQFFANPSAMDTEMVTITNTTSAKINVWLSFRNSASDQYRIIDSNLNIEAGSSINARIRFEPGKTANGVIIGVIKAMNATSRCIQDSIVLLGNVKPNLCLETEHESSYNDPMLIGASADHQFRLINQSGAAITIPGIIIYDSAGTPFKISSSLPIVVPPYSNDHFLTYSFSPKSDFSGTYFATEFVSLQLEGDSITCSSVKALLIGNVVKPGGGSGIDTNIRGLYPSVARTLAIEGSGQTTTTEFTFRNNLNVPVTVNKVYMKSGLYFSVAGTNPSPVPFVLSSNQDMKVTVRFDASDNQVHDDSLLIDASHNLQTIAFAIQGKQESQGSVEPTLSRGIKISISPNPASENVLIDLQGIGHANVEVFDVLGKLIISAPLLSSWKWDVATVSEGIYTIRIDGENIDGKHFVASERVIVRR
jgi:hypothetical protein